jgi:hypothetical protein
MADNPLQQGIAALKAGDKAQARRLLGRAIQRDPQDEQAWLWLSGAVDTDQEKLTCLKKVLAINPENEKVRNGIAALEKRRISPPEPQSEQSSQFTRWPTPAELESRQHISELLDHSQTLEQMSPESRRALQGYTQLIAHELTGGTATRSEIIERLVKRGFPRTAVDQLISQIEKTKQIRKRGLRTQRMPPWGWPFFVACALIPIVSWGGCFPAAVGITGASLCAAVALDTRRNTALRIGLCIAATLVCWTVFLAWLLGAFTTFS